MCSMKRNKKQEIHPRIICCHTLNATEGRLEPGYIGYGTEWLYHGTFLSFIFRDSTRAVDQTPQLCWRPSQGDRRPDGRRRSPQCKMHTAHPLSKPSQGSTMLLQESPLRVEITLVQFGCALPVVEIYISPAWWRIAGGEANQNILAVRPKKPTSSNRP